MLERDRIIEIVAAVASVIVMLGAMTWIGFTYGNEQYLGDEGAPMMIGAIVGFIILVTLVGVGLAYTISDPTPPGEDDADADAAA